jgi:hypothetical protein
VEPESRSAPQWLDGAAAAVSARNCVDDRKAESGTAALPRARAVGASPSVEDAGQRVGWNADTRV